MTNTCMLAVFFPFFILHYLYLARVMHLCWLWKLGKDRLTIPSNHSRVLVYSLHLITEYMLFVHNHEWKLLVSCTWWIVSVAKWKTTIIITWRINLCWTKTRFTLKLTLMKTKKNSFGSERIMLLIPFSNHTECVWTTYLIVRTVLE